jgi:hypothetical protein
MSSFIAAQNQEMLWRTIQKNPLFGKTLSQEQQPIWFREIIGNFYSGTTNKNLNSNELLELNKNVIRYMVHNLNEHTSQSTFNEPINDRLQPQSLSYQGDYDKLQSNYNNMHQRDVPQEPNFKEQIDDEKITNMDELLQQQLKDRELETQTPSIRTLSNSNNNAVQSQSQSQSQSQNTNVKLENSENYTKTANNDIGEIKNMFENYTKSANNDIGEIKNMFETLLRRMDDFERKINVAQSQRIHQQNNDEILTLQM